MFHALAEEYIGESKAAELTNMSQQQFRQIRSMEGGSAETCPLLTGDAALRQTAESEQVEVKGTVWLIEELVRQQCLSIDLKSEIYAPLLPEVQKP